MPHGGQHPTEEAINITRKFLGGEMGTPGEVPRGNLPSQASSTAQGRAFGQQGQRRRKSAAAGRLNPGDIRTLESGPSRQALPIGSVSPMRLPAPGASLSDRLFDLPGPVGFAQTPQGRAILQRILGLRGVR